MSWEGRFTVASSVALVLAVVLAVMAVALRVEAITVVSVLIALWIPLLLITLSIVGLGALGGLMDRATKSAAGAAPAGTAKGTLFDWNVSPHMHAGGKFCVFCGIKLA
jgi:hypothetical protein